MELTQQRLPSSAEWTFGGLFDESTQVCFTLEDQAQAPGVVVAHETRIPAGRYRVLLRREGPLHERYAADPRVSDVHQGMLWLQDVPGRTFIYFHLGNKDADTDGCILTGDVARLGGTIESSLPAYRRLYLKIIQALAAGEDVWVTISD